VDLHSEGAIVAVVSPGTAETAMLGSDRSAYRASTVASVCPAPSAAGMIGVIDRLDPVKAAQGMKLRRPAGSCRGEADGPRKFQRAEPPKSNSARSRCVWPVGLRICTSRHCRAGASGIVRIACRASVS
jgi:hypothetical protein